MSTSLCYFTILAFAATLMAGCGKSSPSASDTDTTEVPLAVEEGPGHDNSKHLPATADFAGHHYDISIMREADDSLAQVKDRFGDPYLDNRVNITIRRDGNEWFKHSFTKADFEDLLDAASTQNFILGGLAFSTIDAQGLHFGAQLNEPGDEEGGLAFKVSLSLSGTAAPRIVRDTNQDTSSRQYLE